MSLKKFLWDKTLAIAFNVAGMIGVCVFIAITAGAVEAVLVTVVWSLSFAFYCTVSFALLRKRIANIKKTVDQTEDRFLLSEIVPAPLKSEDSLYYELMLLQGRAAIERVTKAEKEKSDYYDYLEAWAHEIKTPIAAAGLICNNNKGEAYNEISRQLDKINHYAEQILYEAKSNNTEKDLLIQETDLAVTVNSCIKENKRLLIDSGVKIETDAAGTVYTDGKWLEFILKQILLNCTQYRKNENAKIKISAKYLPGGKTELSVSDNGIGILKSEIGRIFDKGFTGTNGRRNKKSTGLGLYLCKKLCAALDIGIFAESLPGEFTKISLIIAAAPEPGGKPYKTVR